jgi:Bacterial aa3 type cytochrome c oxidase subunit IV
MADHGPVEYATAQGNDLPAHEAMYDRFVHLVFVGCAHLTSVVVGLAIGAVAGQWLVAFAIFVIATLVAIHGFLTGKRLPSMVMVVLSLLALALSSGGGSPTGAGGASPG